MTLSTQSSSSSRANDSRKKYEDCKAIIQSLLISTAEGLTAVQLNRDYDELEGQKIPFLALGYPSLESLLRSMSDVLRMRYMGNMLLLEACATPETAHVRQLVQEQKKTRPSRGRGGLLTGGSNLSRRGTSRGSSRGRGSSSSAGRPYFYKRAYSQPPTRPLKQGLVMDRQFVTGFTQNNLAKMMMNYPQGVPMDKLNQLYYDQFGHQLRCAGHNNTLSIVMALPHLFSLRDHNGCTLLYSNNGMSVNQCNLAPFWPAKSKTSSVSQPANKPASAVNLPPGDEEEWGTSDEEEIQSHYRESAAKEGTEPLDPLITSHSIGTTGSVTVTSATESFSVALVNGTCSQVVTEGSSVSNESRSAFGFSMNSTSHEMTSSAETTRSGNLQDAKGSVISSRSTIRTDTSGRSVAAGYPGLCAASASAMKRAVVAASKSQTPVANVQAPPAFKDRMSPAAITRVFKGPKKASTKVELLPAKFVKNFIPTPIRAKPVQIWPPPEGLAGRDNQAPVRAEDELEDFILVDGKFEYASYLDDADGPNEDCPVYIPGNPTASSNGGLASHGDSVTLEEKHFGNMHAAASRPRLFSLGNPKTKTTPNSLKITALALAGKCDSEMNKSNGSVPTASPTVQKFADSIRAVWPPTTVSKTSYEKGTNTAKGVCDKKSASRQLGRPKIDISAVKALLNKAQIFAKEQSKYDPLTKHVSNSFADQPNNTINRVLRNRHGNGNANDVHNILSTSLKASPTTISNGTNQSDQPSNSSTSLKPSATTISNGTNESDQQSNLSTSSKASATTISNGTNQSDQQSNLSTSLKPSSTTSDPARKHHLGEGLASGKTSCSVASTQRAAPPSASCHIPRKVLDGLQVAIENVTNPHNISPDQILRAYQNVTGEPLSLPKLGLVSILELVKAVPHLLTVTPGRYGGHTFAATANTQEHIQKRPLQTLENIRLMETLSSRPQGLTEDQLLQSYRGDWPACPDDLWYPVRGYSSLAELLQTAPVDSLQLRYRRQGPQHGEITKNAPQDLLVYPANVEVKESFEEGLSEEVWEPQEKRLRPLNSADPGQQYKTVQGHPLLQAGGVFRDVMVAEVFSPRNFWILYDRTALDDLMEKMRAHFERAAPWDALLLRQEDYMPGAMVAANYPHDGDFYRAAIVAVKTNGKAEVFCVDYGTLFTAERNMVMYLPQQFADVPVFALHACLWGIAPSEKSSGGKWQGAATKRFLDLVYDTPHTATTRARQDNTLLLSLTNDASEGVSDVAKRLVLERFAIRATEVILSEDCGERDQISDALPNEKCMEERDDSSAHSTPLSTLPTEGVEQGSTHSAPPESVDLYHKSEYQPPAASVCDGMTTRSALSDVHYHSGAQPSHLPVQGIALHIDASTNEMVYQTVPGSFHAPLGQDNGSFHGLQGRDTGGFFGPQVQDDGSFNGPQGQDDGGFHGLRGQDNGGFHGPQGQDNGGFNGLQGQDNGGFHGSQGQDDVSFNGPQGQDDVSFFVSHNNHVLQVVENGFSGNSTDYSGQGLNVIPDFQNTGGANGGTAALGGDGAEELVLGNSEAGCVMEIGYIDLRHVNDSDLSDSIDELLGYDAKATDTNNNLSAFGSTHIGEPGKTIPSEAELGNLWYRNIPFAEVAPSSGLGGLPQIPASSPNNAPECSWGGEYLSIGQRDNLRSASAPPMDALSSSINYINPYDVVHDGRVNNSFSYSLLNSNIDGGDAMKTDLTAGGMDVSNNGLRDSKAGSESGKNDSNVFTLDQLLQLRNLNVKQQTHLNNINNINITNNAVEVGGARFNMGKPIVACNTLTTGPFDYVELSQSNSVAAPLDLQPRSVVEHCARGDAFNLAAPSRGWAGDTITNRVWANEGDQGWLPNNQSASQVWANNPPNQVWSNELCSNRLNQDQMVFKPQQQQQLFEQQQFGSNTNLNSLPAAALQLLQNNQNVLQPRQLHQQTVLSNIQQQQFPQHSSNQQQLALFQQQQLDGTGACAGDRASGSAAPIRVADRQLMETAMTSLAKLRSDLLQQLAQFPDREDIIIQLEDIKTKLKRLRNLSVELA